MSDAAGPPPGSHAGVNAAKQQISMLQHLSASCNMEDTLHFAVLQQCGLHALLTRCRMRCDVHAGRRSC